MQIKSLNLKNLLLRLYSQASNIRGIVKKDIIVSSMTDTNKPGVSLWVILRSLALNQAFLLKAKERPNENITGTPKYANGYKIKNKFSNEHAVLNKANVVMADKNTLNLSVFHKFFINLNIKYVHSYKPFMNTILSYLNRRSKGLLCLILIFPYSLALSQENTNSELNKAKIDRDFYKESYEYYGKKYDKCVVEYEYLLKDFQKLKNEYETLKRSNNTNSNKTTFYQEKDLYDDLEKYIAKQNNQYGRPMGVIAAHRIIERGGPEFDKYYRDFLRKMNQKAKK